MGQLKGKYAGISVYDGTDDHLIKEAFSQELNLGAERVDGTRFLDEFQREVPIYATWGGSFECYFDPSDEHFLSVEEASRTAQSIQEVLGENAEIRLWLTDSYYYGGDASFDMSITSSKDDLIKANVTINGAGALTRATDGAMPTGN
ncbi:MAG: hypothetical protein ACOCQD_03120 [archaeon]